MRIQVRGPGADSQSIESRPFPNCRATIPLSCHPNASPRGDTPRRPEVALHPEADRPVQLGLCTQQNESQETSISRRRRCSSQKEPFELLQTAELPSTYVHREKQSTCRLVTM